MENILTALTNSCLKKRPNLILPFLKSKNVTTSFPNKTSFYFFYKYMVLKLYNNSKGKLKLIIETDKENNEIEIYNFYDEVHKYPRLTLYIKELKNKIIIDISPL